MKRANKILALLCSTALVLSMTACAGNNVSAPSGSNTGVSSGTDNESTEKNGSASADITEKIMKDVSFASMAEVKADRLTSFYDFDSEKLDNFSAFICGSGAYPDELAVFKLKSSDDVDALKAVLQKRIDKQYKTFENYTPDEMYKFDNSNIVTNGLYVGLIISKDNASAKSLFNDMTK